MFVTPGTPISTSISAPDGKPTYAKAIRAINEVCDPTDYLVSAAGGLPGELNTGWHSKSVHSFDSEYGYSTMGYEIAGAWGAKMALPDRDVICWTGDGSYLMMNSDIYSTVMTGHKVIFIVCDNGGFAVINRLQVNTGGEEFNNLLRSSRHERATRVDFAKHAEAMGAIATKVDTIDGLKQAFAAAKKADRSSVIVLEVDEYSWTEGGAWWEVGVPEVSDREQVQSGPGRTRGGTKASTGRDMNPVRPRARCGDMTGRPTIVDVAERAGVSKSLVSLVMRNSPSVSDEKRERVLKAASELDYRPNAMARSLVRQRTYVIGVVISDFSNPFFAEVAGGIEEAALAADYRALFNSGDRDPVREAQGPGNASSASNRRAWSSPGRPSRSRWCARSPGRLPMVVATRDSRSRFFDSVVGR